MRRRWVTGFALLWTGSGVAPASGGNPLVLPPPAVAADHGACFDTAAAAYGLNAWLLRAIARVESNHDPLAANENGGSRGQDIGIMQINSRWLETLSAQGLDPTTIGDPCTNIYVGAWVLRGNLLRYGPTWRAVGAYHASSRREDLRVAYVKKVMRALHEEMGSSGR